MTPPRLISGGTAPQEPQTARSGKGPGVVESPAASQPAHYTAEQDQAILKAFEGLRVADLSDGMDAVGLQDVGLMNPAIAPLSRNTENFEHRFCGIAVTVAMCPPTSARRADSRRPFTRSRGKWYRELSPEPFVELLRPGSVIVIDGHDDGDTGTIGSNNSMLWKSKGAVGIVTSGGARDTDEIIKEKIPALSTAPGRGIRPGRNEVESVGRPITCGGVLVRPGDVVVGDGDGVIVVPREQAMEVARVAREILETDQARAGNSTRKLRIAPGQHPGNDFAPGVLNRWACWLAFTRTSVPASCPCPARSARQRSYSAWSFMCSIMSGTSAGRAASRLR